MTAGRAIRHRSDTVPLPVVSKAEAFYLLPQSITASAVRRLHLPDPGVLMTCGLDGTEALIALTERPLETAKPESFFEGWYADAGANEDVFNPVGFMQRDQ